MAIIKCKMCGGDISVSEDKTFGTCEYCGSTMTFPKVSDEQRAALFNRGNHFRRQGEFDKALSVYENIVRENDADAEAHWCCALCRFGIEYVEDPNTYEYIPTCHRASFDSFLEDVDYLASLENSDGITKRQYQKDAAKIAEVQKGILATSHNEEPFDVFICYKETDDITKERTKDSIDAQEIYYQLTNEGYRVFFSRITLEDKAGTEYEPYIFAALNSAKVMVAVGSKPEYFNAVWVKNEWSRFLALMRKDRSKLLLPCYKNMDPYDLPEQLSVLQSYDMGKIGFIQDLIRGIKKVASKDEPREEKKETAVVNAGSGNTAPLLKRAFMYLEDGEWQSADEYAEKVLDQDPENCEAYLAKLMAELKVRKREALSDCPQPFDESNNFKKAVRFGDKKLGDELNGCIKHINERNENVRLTGIYNGAVKAMNSAGTETAYKAAVSTFKTIPGFKDADILSEQCLERAEICRKDSIYANARSQMTGEAITGYEAAIRTFQKISGWKDADEQIIACQRKIEEIKVKEEVDRLERERQAEEKRIAKEKTVKKRKRIFAIVTPIVAACLAFVILLTMVIIPNSKYNAAVKLYDTGNYYESITAFSELNGYKDSEQKIIDCKYSIALSLLDSGEYNSAYALLNEIGKSEMVAENKYTRAIAFLESGEYNSAYALLNEIGKSEMVVENKYTRAIAFLEAGEYDSAIVLFNSLGDYKDSTEKNNAALYAKADLLEHQEKYEEAYLAFMSLEDYSDSANRAKSIKPRYEALLISRASVGDIVMFGSYEQDNNTTNGKEDIEWIVLKKQGNRVLIISKYALDCKPYHSSDTAATWETCSLRNWLNSTFLNAAFSSSEQQMIQTTLVKAERHPWSGVSSGRDTNDKIYLLSISEAEALFSSNEKRYCEATAYAIAQGTWHPDGTGKRCRWWLRSPGEKSYYAATVFLYGGVEEDGIMFSGGYNKPAVRPVMWIDYGN